MRSTLSLLLLIFLSSALSARQLDVSSLTGFHPDRVEQQLQTEQFLINHHNPAAFREHLYQLTKDPHIAGTAESRAVIEYMSRVMARAGLKVEHFDYDAWMPQPGEVKLSLIRPIRMPLNNQEYIYDEDPYSAHPGLGHGWNAYSGSGSVTAEVVYANYGRKEDFEQLKQMGVSVEGKIVIARYGGNFRGFKAKFAEQAGASGLIIYTDPANGGFTSGLTYPEGRYSDESAIQRGSLLTLDYYGDPLTPFEAALPLDGDVNVERLDPESVGFHTLPVAPIGYGAAREILSRMAGDPVPGGWQGGLPFTYRLTGGSELQVQLEVDQPHEFTRITNVIGTVEGSTYPDEWIIVGSHHDAWGFGATDPNSGTAMLLTLAESLGEMVQNGYRPKRSIMIAHWDAEEFLLIGSTEWVEQLREELDAGAVLYLNADMSVTGPNFRSSASPSLKKPIMEAARVVPHPDSDRTMYETWITPGAQEPPIGNLGGGSDHVGFYMHAGIPSAGLSISGSVPIYHTNFDSFSFYEKMIDSTFSYGPALAGVYGVVATRFANADLLPYDIVRYTGDITRHVESISNRAGELNRKIEAGELLLELSKTEKLAMDIENRIPLFLSQTPSEEEKREINQLLIQLERSFLDEEGLGFSKWQQSLYAATDPWSGYASWMIPGVRYVLEDEIGEEALRAELHRFTLAVARLNRTLDQIVNLIR